MSNRKRHQFRSGPFLNKRIWVVLLVAALFLLVPQIITSSYWMYILDYSLIFALAGIGLNLIGGYVGMISLGHPAFYALGAYVTAILMLKSGFSFWLALPISLILSTIFGIVVGRPVLRLAGHYFAVATLCLSIVIYAILVQWLEFTGGSVGLVGIPRVSLLGYVFEERHQVYYLILSFFIITYVLMYNLVRSPAGRAFKAIRESESAAASLGINVALYKVIAFAIGGAIAALAGSLYVALIGYVNPASVASLDLVLIFWVTICVGGMGTMFGPLFGALFTVVLPEFIEPLGEYKPLFFGSLLVGIVMFIPGGIASLLSVLKELFGKSPFGGKWQRQRVRAN